MTVAHRIGVMNRGKLVQVGAPAEVYEQPNSRWVAEFVGDVNLIDGVVTALGADGAVVETGLGTFRAPAGPAAKPGARVSLALRPEKLRIATAPPAGGENRVAGRVIDIAYLGDISVYKVRLDDGASMKASVANATRLVERAIGWDDRVWLSWTPDAAVVLSE